MARLSLGQRLCLCAAVLAALAAAAWFLLPRDSEKNADAPLRIGAGDDVTGVLLDEVCRQAAEHGREELVEGSYVFVDCCAGTAQWALESADIDMGFYCVQAASRMTKESEAFEIYGPVIQNGEVLASLRGTEEIRRAAIPRRRSFLEDALRSAHPEVEEVTQLNRAYALLTLESGETDGAVIDVGDARRAGEDVGFSPVSAEPYLSYCLVVRRSVEETEAFSQFLEDYEAAVERLNDPGYLTGCMGMDEAFWSMAGTEFLHLP